MQKVSIEELAQFEDQYIALSEDRSKVLASGKTIKDLEANLKKLGIKEAVIEFVEPAKAFLSPVCL